ncbi:hypothetical protein [uncultured Acetobacteroides sp.]|uniref:hypothetical protein n=1 Tax=uncultured Acetobacteroides sp. TaxID=1760811 RepID=UPI0029F584B7|nr:hypothetical protein [uncultured Acetobacteroides sp.]
MKRQILISLILLSSVLTMNAQTWSGSTPGNIYYNQGFVGLGSTPQNPLHIQYNINSGSLLFGLNNLPMGTEAMSYSPNLFLFLTRLDASLGLHAYVYRKSASTSWTAGTVRLSSSADGNGYSQDNRYNNLNWIDFIGNGYGIDMGCVSNAPALSIRDKSVGIGTTSPSDKLQIGDFNNTDNLKINLPGVYNFEQVKLGQYGNGNCGLEFVNHSGASSSYGIRFLSSCDNDQFGNPGMYGLQIQTANPSGTYQGLSYTTRLALSINGNIGIGTNSPTYKLDVIGTIRAREIKVDLNGADFVFEKDYKLMPLNELENFIKEQKHLPEIAPAKDMKENGTDLGNLNSKLLQKIEELTLYTLEQNNAIKELKQAMKLQSEEIEKLKATSK